MPAIVLEETQHIGGHYRAEWLRRLPADANWLGSRTPFACPNDNSIRITKDCRARITGFVLEESLVLLLQPVRPALVIIVEERDERTIRVREQGVPRLGNTAIRPVTDKADLVMRPFEFLQHYG